MSANLTTDSRPSQNGGQTQVVIDEAVSDIFDELLTEISAKTKLHCSEQVDRDNRMSHFNSSKLYDFVNSYHAYCKLCEQHFYSRSSLKDINSFFQAHVNTTYHRQQRSTLFCSDDVPILTWEQPLLSAKCSVCDLTGLKPFVIDTKFCIRKLMHQHVCIWSWEQRETNEKFLRKLNLLKKYCGLKIFQKKFLRTINGREVCLLCGVRLPWSKEKASCHLKSDTHYQKFCMFIWKNFSFAPKDILNGFNLETVTRWLMMYDPPMWTNLVDYNELAVCLNDTNNCGNPYPEDKKNTSYSPTNFEMAMRVVDIDFINNNECLLCNVELDAGHFTSSMHRSKALDLGEGSFGAKNLAIYLQNREKRLQPFAEVIESHKKLKDKLKEQLKGEVRDKKASSAIPANYIHSLLAKKLSLVDKVMTKIYGSELFCHVCDQYLHKSNREAHLGSYDHRSQMEKWSELRENFGSKRFLEPFKKIRNVIICLLCGAVIHTNSFFSHLKGGMHARKLELYMSLDLDFPISSAFIFREDFSCCCSVCDTLLSKNKSLKTTLKEIKCHWPCPYLKKERKKDPANEMEMTLHDDAGLAEAMSEQSENQGDETEGVLTRKGKPIQSVEKSFNAIKDYILDKSLYLRDCLDDSRLVDDGVKARSGEGDWPPVCVKGPVGDSKKGLESACCATSACTCCSPAAENEGRGEERKEKRKKTVNELRNDKRKDTNLSEEDGKEDEDMAKHEALIIKGLPRKKRRHEIIYSHFEVFGKIQYVLFDSKEVVVAFTERGVAGAAALEAKDILHEPKLGVIVVERNSKKKKGKTAVEELVLDKDIISLLEEPQKLMDFMLCLTFQAMKTSQSEVETKREAAVCNMIVHAVLEKFPLCRCYPFGSRLTGLSLNNSDLDVFLDCGGMYEGFKNTSPSTEKKLVRTVAAALRKVPGVSDIIVVDSARVPIVSFQHKPTGLACDISFKNGLSIQNSMLIKFLVSLDWRVKPMILFMKCWAKLNGLHGSPYFSSYTLSMLVINYLEQLQIPVLPTIESLQNSYVGRRVTIGGWDCSINTNKATIQKPENTDSVPVLLAGLFEFYANFEFDKNVLFPLNGKALPREAFYDSGRKKLPMCFKRHVLNVPAPIENLVSDRFPICIIDPFDLSHVLTKSFTSQGLMQFIYFCHMSKQYLKKGMTES